MRSCANSFANSFADRLKSISRVILCRLCARLSRVRPCTLLSAFAQAPRLTRNCFPNRTNAQSIVGFARGCGANGRQFPRDTLSPLRTPQSCTSLYTPFGVYAGSSSDAELLSKRERTRNPLSGLRFFSVMYVFVHSRRKIRALRALRAAAAQTADNSRAILCRLCARLSRVRSCTLLSAFAQAPRLTRNCFPNGGERAIRCRACARLRRKRHVPRAA